jgi:hypothetical protein
MDFLKEFLGNLKATQPCALDIHKKIESSIRPERFKRLHGFQLFDKEITPFLENCAHCPGFFFSLIQGSHTAGLRKRNRIGCRYSC